jgi:uncharacterized protein YbcV (DUF1398 family)
MDQQAREEIEQCAADALTGKESFPQLVGRLQRVGVARYHVDFLRAEKTCYLRDGASHVTPLPMPPEPVAEEFSAAGVASAVRASQTEGLPFSEFLARARRAGCIGYVAYLDGRRVIYSGPLGDAHVEHFPS